MYRHEFRKNFAMMQPPKMHEICPRGTKNEKKSNEQKLISIFHFLPNFRISREWLISLNEKKKIPRNLVKPIFKCFPLIGVDFAHNPSSPYHLGEVRSVPCYKYARRQYLARASLARPNTSFVYPRTPWVIRDHSPFAQTRQLVSRMWKSVFVQVHPLSSCVYSRPAQLSWLICMTSFAVHTDDRPALYNTLPPFLFFLSLPQSSPVQCSTFMFAPIEQIRIFSIHLDWFKSSLGLAWPRSSLVPLS